MGCTSGMLSRYLCFIAGIIVCCSHYLFMVKQKFLYFRMNVSTEQFTFSCNDFESSFSSSFKELRKEANFLDCTLSTGLRQLQAHKVILAAFSPVFKSLLKDNQYPNYPTTIYLRGVKFTDLKAVLDFIYNGEVKVAMEDLDSFLAVAADLKLKGLSQTKSELVASSVPRSVPEISDQFVGWLVPAPAKLGKLACGKVKIQKNKKFTVGREANCNMVLEESMFESNDESLRFNNLSRIQFEIYYEGGRLCISDKSSNGTFLNHIKLSPGEDKCLKHGDIISVLQEDLEIFFSWTRKFYLKNVSSVKQKTLVTRCLNKAYLN